MCGIAGVVGIDPERGLPLVRLMMDAVRHRGPDGEGITSFDQGIFGHVRLSLVGLDDGAQPMWNASNQHVITFNGEIYGFRDIKRHLNYPFSTSTDTEVVLALYKEKGLNFLAYLPGMFAFAIWDSISNSLVAARDRFGEKPFYYAIGLSGEFIFSSEIKGILASGLIEPEIDPVQISHYLQHLYVHPHRSIYKNIHLLPPASMLIWQNGRLSITNYWEFPEIDHRMHYDSALEEFSLLLKEAVKKQLVADVPVGAFLSGGLDSSTLVALATQSTSNLSTFSFGFEGSHSELSYAEKVATRYGTQHFEFRQEEHDIASMLVRMQTVFDEPLADSAVIPTYLISQSAARHVKAILAGEGADELLGGYDFWYNKLELIERAISTGNVEFFFLRLLHAIRYRVHPYKNRRVIDLFEGERQLKQFGSVSRMHSEINKYVSDTELAALGLKNYEPDIFNSSVATTGDRNEAMRHDLKQYLPGDILVKTDRASMAHGLEVRAPFLDLSLAELCLKLPLGFKIGDKYGKRILRESFHHLWPEEVAQRPKQGFGGPIQSWLKSRSFMQLRRDFLNDPKKEIFQVISFERAQKFIGKSDHREWALLNLSLWFEYGLKR